MLKIDSKFGRHFNYSLNFIFGIIIFFLILAIGGLNEIFTASVFAPHDSFYPINDNFSQSVFGIFSARTNFSKNIVSVFVHIPDYIFIAIFKTFLSNHWVQVLHVITCEILLFWTSFNSFYKLCKSNWYVIPLTLAYCFSPYMAILYTSGVVYTFSTVLCIGLMPYFLVLILSVLRGEREAHFLPILVMMALGVLYIFPLLLLIFFGLIFIYLSKGGPEILKIFRNNCKLSDLAFLVLCLTPFIYFIYIDRSILEKINFLSNSTYDSLRGGLFYPAMQISSWAIYSNWSPRAILNFSNYYFDASYKILSIGVMIVTLRYLLTSKKYLFIYLLFLAIFFAKGSDVPFGEIFLFIVNHLPLGYMIRSPDSKFGALIAAFIVLGVAYSCTQKSRLPLAFLSIFLLSNILGMYWHGAISPSRGGSSTYFIEDKERDDLVRLINQQDNYLVLTNASNCDGKYYQGLFHTCADIVLSAVNHQVVGSEFGGIEHLAKVYQPFPKLVYVNRNLTGKRPLDISALERLGFYSIYESKNYFLFKQVFSGVSCSKIFSFSCIIQDNQFLVSAPLSYAKFHYPDLTLVEVSQYVRFPIEPSQPNNSQFYYLVALYVVSLCICVIFYLRSNKSDTNSYFEAK